MKNLSFLLFTLLMVQSTVAQQSVTLKNSPAQDRDALIGTKTGASEDDDNFMQSPDLGCGTWTYGPAGTGKNRCYLTFDWSAIPANATIVSAKLNLYAFGMGYIHHGGHAGTNVSAIRRVTTTWKSDSVTWNNQPSFTSDNEVTLAQSTSTSEDYINIDVTQLVLDMQSNQAWYGFLFISKDESTNGVLTFGSSNHSDSTLRPELEIEYTLTSSVVEEQVLQNVRIANNASSDPQVIFKSAEGYAFSLYTLNGQQLGSLFPEAEGKYAVKEMSQSPLAPGLYFLRITTPANTSSTFRILIE